MKGNVEALAETHEGAERSDGLVLAKKNEAVYVAGRREWMKYRELGVAEASAGTMRAQVTSASQGLSEPTGWHVHLCEGQLVYMLDGWVELAFAGARIVRLEAGDSLYIPGGTPHNEVATSDAFELLEVSMPADMGTKPCDPPDA